MPVVFGKVPGQELYACSQSRCAESLPWVSSQCQLPGPDWHVDKFRETVASFANEGPGDLVIGVVEQGGVATQVPGCVVDDVDRQVLQLDQLIADGLDQDRATEAGLEGKKHTYILDPAYRWAAPKGKDGQIVTPDDVIIPTILPLLTEAPHPFKYVWFMGEH